MPFKSREDKRRYDRERWARLRSEWFAGKSCVCCGSTEDLELHHREPSEKIGHRVWSWSAERRALELAKCEVRCRDCHQYDHALHGTLENIISGCECVVCRRTGGARMRQLHREAAA